MSCAIYWSLISSLPLISHDFPLFLPPSPLSSIYSFNVSVLCVSLHVSALSSPSGSSTFLSHQFPPTHSFLVSSQYVFNALYSFSLSALSGPLIRLVAFSLRCRYDHWNNAPVTVSSALYILFSFVSLVSTSAPHRCLFLKLHPFHIFSLLLDCPFLFFLIFGELL